MVKKVVLGIFILLVCTNVYAQDLVEYEDERVSFQYTSDLFVTFNNGIYHITLAENNPEIGYDPIYFTFGISIFVLNSDDSIYPSLNISNEWEQGYIIGLLSFRQQFFHI